jgi:glycosyltransferase involved in cell wall biosynthesis
VAAGIAASISVALCTHNGARFLEEQLRSILAQRLRPTEIVISDDASTDDTLDVIRAVTDDLAAASIDLKVLRNEVALGVTANFERAVLACSGDLVALCDQDDVWHPDRLLAVAPRFERSPELLLLSSNARLVDEAGESIGHTLFDGLDLTDATLAEVRAGNGFQALLRRNLATGATTMFRRRLAELAVPFPEPWVHDEWLTVIAAATGRFEIADELLIDYRQHDRNQIGARRRGFVGKLKRIVEPRGGRYDYLVVRSEVLLGRLQQLGGAVPVHYLDELTNKLAHLRFRQTLPVARLRRILPVIGEARTGRYSRYSRGAGDVLRDFLQPV